MHVDWTSSDKHLPAWRIQTSLSSDCINLSDSDVYLEIFKWVGDDFGIIIDDHPTRPKRKPDEKPPISPPKAKRSRDSTKLRHGKREKVVRKSGDWDDIEGKETGRFDNLKNNKGKKEGRGKERKNERNKERKKVKKVKEEMEVTWEKSYEDATMQNLDREERDDMEEVMVKGKGKEREDAGISGHVTRRNAIKSGKYLTFIFI